jgi:membrane-associated phospholipid phosphatase
LSMQSRRFGRRFDPESRVGLELTLWAAAVFFVLVVFGILLAFVRARVSFVQTVDHSIANHLNTFANAHHGLVHAMEWVSTVGAPRTFWVLTALLVVVALIRHAYRLAIWAAVTMAGAAFLDVLLKSAVARSRPHFEHAVAAAPGGSFPSGHALESFVGCGIAILAIAPALSAARRRVLVVVAVLVVLTIGFSRVFLGVHFASDVIGGWIFGAGWLAAMVAAFRLWRGSSRLGHRGGSGRSKGRPVLKNGIDPADSDRLVSS